MHQHQSHHHRARARRTGRDGAVLLEALLALTLVAVGLLAWLASAARLAWLDGRTRADLQLAASADRWRERLATRPCDALADGVELDGAVRVHWTVRQADGLHLLSLHLAQPHGAGWRTVERQLARRCAEAP
jgi:hypothetical protein